MINCKECGQPLPEEKFKINDVKAVAKILKEFTDSEDFHWDWEMNGSAVNLKEFAPSTWRVSVIDNHSDLTYDSYGGVSSSEAYIIILVSSGTENITYKVDGDYTSYDGWDWYWDRMQQVKPTPVTVTRWESV
jgi:hypothetical protein